MTVRSLYFGMWNIKLEALRPESQELLGLDALRFIAAIGIVIGHALGRTDTFANLDTRPLRLFVDLFFLISGYVIAHVYWGRINSSGEYFKFLVKRVARLIPLHWLTLLGAIGVGLVVWYTNISFDNSGLFDPACIIPNAFLIHALGTCSELSFNAPSWSISAEAVMYILTPLIFWLMRWRLCFWLSVIGVFTLLSNIPGEAWHSWTSTGGALRALPSFMLGNLIYRERHLVKHLPLANAFVFLALLSFTVSFAWKMPDIILLLFLYLAAIAAVAGDLNCKTSVLLKVIAPLGQLTYSIYMIHFLWLLFTVSFLAVRVFGLKGEALDFSVALSVVSVIGVSYLSLQLFENPSRQSITRKYMQWLNRKCPPVVAPSQPPQI
jgi:peptidoglycan/LPS O-acetylase OafA/YrhL